MSTESEIKLARYSEKAREADALGRVITVRRLKPSEEGKISEMLNGMVGYEELTNDEGEVIKISHRMPYVISASVCQIDDAFIPFPRNRAELDAIYDRLDREGLTAAGKAFVKLTQTASYGTIDDAKNLSGTPSSA
jgi:hypothetical protein